IMQMAALPLYLRTAFRMPDGRPLDAWIIGVVVSTFLISETLFKVPFGILSDRYGRKPFIALGTLVSALTPLGMRVAGSPYTFLPLRAVDGMGSAALWPTVFASVASLTTAERRVAAMSIFNMTYLIGVSLALPVYSTVYSHVRHHANVFLVVSAVFGTATLLAVLCVPPVPKERPDAGTADDQVAREGTSIRAMMTLARSSRLILEMMTLSLIYTMGINMLSGTISLWAKEVLGLAEEKIGLIFVGPGLVVVLLAVPLGWIGGRWGKTRSVRFGMAVAAVAMWVIPHTRSLLTLTAVVAPLIIGFLMAVPAWMAMVTEAAPPGKQGTVVSAIATAQGIGAMVAPAIGGRLYDWSPSWPFYGSAALLTASFILALVWLKEPAGEMAVRA
ncbi:MAG: MFS transporter, partial [Armatimonadota bacterium]